MAVIMKRSTNSAPESLSTSYLTGSAFIGISMMTLNSCGTLSPAVTLLMLIYFRILVGREWGRSRSSYYTVPLGHPPRYATRDTRSVDGDRARSAAGGE